MYWDRSDEEFDDRLVQLADAYAACRDAFFESADAFHWRPHEGSTAARDAAELPSPDPAVETAQGETGHRLIAEVVQTFLMVASHHMGGLAALHTNREVFFPPSMLVRAVIENCAHAVWVLGASAGDEDTSVDRLSRAYLEDLLSAEEAKKNAGRLADKTTEEYLDSVAEYDGIKSEIRTRFGASAEQLGRRTINGQTMPGLETSVMDMFQHFHDKLGGGIDARTAQGMYGYLSNMTHPTLYPARQLRIWVTDAHHPGEMVTTLERDAAFLQKQATTTAVVFFNTLGLTTRYFGWPVDVLTRLRTEVNAAIPGAIG